MKQAFPLALAAIAALVLSATPALALSVDVSGTCNIDRRTTRSRCERAKVVQKSHLRSTVQYRTTPEKELILERRLLRRSDLTDRGFTKKTNLENLRTDRIDALKKRRTRARYEEQKRMEGKRTRDKVFEDTRSAMLRDRIRLLGRTENFYERSEQRMQADSQQAASQRRRASIRKAHEGCKQLGVGEREECLRKAQKALQ